MPDTLTSFIPLVTTLWMLALAVSWTGWGALAGRLLFGRQVHQAGWGLLAVWGMSFTIVAGGLINAAGLISVGTLNGFTMTGVALWLLHQSVRATAWRRASGPIDADTVRECLRRRIPAAALMAVATYALREWFLSPCCGLTDVDDAHGFLVFPLKMLQTGQLSADAFNRTLSSSPGGQAFLQALVLTRLSAINVGALDPMLSTGLLVGLLMGHQRAHGASGVSTWLAGSLPLLALRPADNASAYTTLIVVFIGLHATLDWMERRTVTTAARSLAVGLLVAALVALKITALPFAVLLLAWHYGRRLLAARPSGVARTVIVEAALAASVSCVLLAPWVTITQTWSGGVPLTLAAADGVAAGPVYTVRMAYARVSDIAGDRFLLPAAVLSALFWIVTKGGRAQHRSTLAFAATTLAGTVALRWVSAGTANTPFAIAVLLVVAAALVHVAEGVLLRWLPALRPGQRGPRRVLATAVAAAVALVMAVTSGSRATRTAAHLRAEGPTAMFSRLFLTPSDEAVAGYRERAAALRLAQATIPSGQDIAVKLREPFLLNFTRNPVHVIDLALVTGFSHAPGTGGDVIAAHLLARGIRYVAYEVVEDAGNAYFGVDDPTCRTPAGAAMVLARRHGETGEQVQSCTQDVAIAAFLADIETLTATRQRLYDNGQFIVLDLAQPRHDTASRQDVHQGRHSVRAAG